MTPQLQISLRLAQIVASFSLLGPSDVYYLLVLRPIASLDQQIALCNFAFLLELSPLLIFSF